MSAVQEIQDPLVSVITPSYNQGRFIRQTIDSVLGQSYPRIEYWVIDGGSTDETVEILRSYGDRLHFLSESDAGQANAINKGMQKCTGEILCYVNSDDTLLPGAIQAVADTFRETHALWVTGDYRIVNEQGKPIQGFVAGYKRFLRRCSSRSLLRFTNYIVQPSTFWRRELTERIGLFDETLRYTMDYDYWLRAFEVAPPQIIHRPLSAFRIHGESKGGSQYSSQFDEELMVLRKHRVGAFAIACHRLHNGLIKAAYRIIK